MSNTVTGYKVCSDHAYIDIIGIKKDTNPPTCGNCNNRDTHRILGPWCRSSGELL